MWIYQIKNKNSGKLYIGQTIKSKVSTRWAEHINALNKNKHTNSQLQCEWNQYGQDAFEFTTLLRCNSVEELDGIERKLIGANKAKGNAYNISEGGQTSRIVYYKTWSGLRSPSGVEYSNIENMQEFARLHNIHDVGKLRQVSRGVRYSYLGWTTLIRNKLDGYKTPQGHKMSVESSIKKSKLYNGIVSPDGAIFNNVIGLTQFCKLHNIKSVGMMSELCAGKIKQYKGWTTLRFVNN